jgi:hypothetical protein
MTTLNDGIFSLSKAIRSVAPPTEASPVEIQAYVARIASFLTGENILRTLIETVPNRAKNYYLEFKSGTIQWVEI